MDLIRVSTYALYKSHKISKWEHDKKDLEIAASHNHIKKEQNFNHG